MSEQDSPIGNDPFEAFYDQMSPEIAEQLRWQPTTSPEELHQLLLLSTSLNECPSEIFSVMAESIPEDSLFDFIDLVETVEQITTDYLSDRSSEADPQLRAFYLNFEQADLIVDGLIAVPVADRQGLRDYLNRDEVCQALNHYMEDNNLYTPPDENIDPEARALEDLATVAITNHDVIPGLSIADLEVTFEPTYRDDLFDTVNHHYWYKEGKEEYVLPSDTVEDIIKETPDELLVPLLLRLDDFSDTLEDDGCSKLLGEISGKQDTSLKTILFGRYIVRMSCVWRWLKPAKAKIRVLVTPEVLIFRALTRPTRK